VLEHRVLWILAEPKTHRHCECIVEDEAHHYTHYTHYTDYAHYTIPANA
jgi:hypothetical protein